MANLSPEAKRVLGSAQIEGLLVRLPAGQLDRKLYLEVNKALESLGGKWNKKAKAHLFESDPTEALRQIGATGAFEAPRDEHDFFPTPAHIAKRVVELADVAEGPDTPVQRVLEPSAGDGALVRAIRAVAPHAIIRAIEIRAQARAALQKAGETSWHRGPELCRVDICDFLSISNTDTEKFDRVVMNPPFSGNRGIDHVLHAWSFLAEGGRLTTILPASLTFRSSKRWTELRALFEAHGGIEELPSGAFRASGTAVNAVIAWADKPVTR